MLKQREKRYGKTCVLNPNPNVTLTKVCVKVIAKKKKRKKKNPHRFSYKNIKIKMLIDSKRVNMVSPDKKVHNYKMSVHGWLQIIKKNNFTNSFVLI